ncbi:MAG: Crp/Fnr family transcriptional regulator [Terriglobales bacterium]
MTQHIREAGGTGQLEETLGPLAQDAIQCFGKPDSVRQYPPDTLLFEEGEKPGGVFLLRSGRVKLGVRSRHGSHYLLELVGVGEMLGLSACVSGKPYEITARTITPCEAVFVPREEFLRFLRDRPSACLEMVRILSADLDTAYERIRHLRRR